ncbi:UNVERIFIED_CONTAM: hypothetical protein RMT77_002658 [Armadillidium vulgare]
MGKNANEWDIEECRTKYESAEHWNLKKDFLLAHKDKFEKERLICLAQVFVNVQLMRCRYPDPVMRQVAELSKGIGVDYKTVQKERLQRTFVKASDAAAAKVKNLKVNYGKSNYETKMEHDEKEISINSESKLKSNATEEPPRKKKKLKKKADNLNEVTETVSNEKGEQSQADCNTVSSIAVKLLKKKKKAKKKPVNEVVEVSDTETFLLKMKSLLSESKVAFEKPAKEEIVITENEKEIPVVNKYSKALKTKPNVFQSTFVSPKVASISLRPMKYTLPNSQPESFCEEYFDPKDLYRCNIFFVSRNFEKYRYHHSVLNGCLQFSKLVMNTAFVPFGSRNEKCILTTKVNGQTLKLGEAIDNERKKGQENAVINAVENLLKKCFTIEIKKRASNDGEISMDSLNQQNKNEQNSEEEKSIGNNNVGAKMLKLMGWSGGGLGKNEDGIKEPISVTTPIGRSGLGVKNENAATPIFKMKVKGVLDEMRSKVLASVDNVVNDIVFSSELSNEQRKHIHLIVRHQYKQLNTHSYGKNQNRYLVVRPKVDIKKLIRCVLSQGGSTDKYGIHKPGTLSVDFFFPQDFLKDEHLGK